MPWTIEASHGGFVNLPRLPDREAVESLLTQPTKRAWGRYSTLAQQLIDLGAERARIESMEIPAAEQHEHDQAVAAVREGRPVEHGPSVGALKERCQRLTVEADAVQVVLGERLGELGAALLHDQARMLTKVLDAFHAIDPEDWRGRCDAALLVAWVAGLQVDGDLPTVSPERECQAHADALVFVPTNFVAQVLEPVADLVAGRPEADVA